MMSSGFAESGLLALIGFGLYAWRSGAFSKSSGEHKSIARGYLIESARQQPKVSIVVPARNEESNLPKIFSSFLTLEYPSLEFVIVDDHSTDRTRELAQKFADQVHKQFDRLESRPSHARSWSVQIIQNPELPGGWGGKNWACHNGFKKSSGDFILFTDADTFHHADSLHIAVGKMLKSGAGLCSAIPYHSCVELWEKLQGVFQSLLLVASGAFMGDLAVGIGNTRGHRIFAIGQYLLFSRKAYEKIGGHEAVKMELVEDIALAHRVADFRLGVEVERCERIVDVRMYPGGFGDFLEGWRRNLNWAFKKSSVQGAIEMIIVVGWLLNAALLSNGLLGISLSYFVAVFLIWKSQKNRGDYPWWSHWLYIIFALVFCWVSVMALVDIKRSTPVKWRGRSYSP